MRAALAALLVGSGIAAQTATDVPRKPPEGACWPGTEGRPDLRYWTYAQYGYVVLVHPHPDSQNIRIWPAALLVSFDPALVLEEGNGLGQDLLPPGLSRSSCFMSVIPQITIPVRGLSHISAHNLISVPRDPSLRGTKLFMQWVGNPDGQGQLATSQILKITF